MLKELKALLASNQIALKKSLGQHLLWDPLILEQIVSNAEVDSSDVILEVGPGAGYLSREILKARPLKLIALEKDQAFKPLLAEIQNANPNFEVIYEDALSSKIKGLATDQIKVISNLPYNVSTKLISNWMQEQISLKSLVLTLQAEVADRICAKQSQEPYGRLSILCQLYFNCSIALELGPEAFFPRPKVQSKVVKMQRKTFFEGEAIVNSVNKLAKLAFSQRRKKIRNSLAQIFASGIASPIDLNKRAEDISLEEYVQLAKWLLECGQGTV